MRNLPDPPSAELDSDPGHHWVRGLRSNSESPQVPVCSSQTIAAAEARVGAESVQWAVDLGARIAERTISRFPEFGGGRTSATTLRLGTEQVAIYMVCSLDAGQMVHHPNTAETTSMIHDYVQRRVPMDRIWAGMRYGHAWLTEEFMAACNELVERDERADELEKLSQILFEQVITYAAELGEIYRVENEDWKSSAEFARNDTLRSVLDGDDLDENTASQVLRYSLGLFHVSLVVSPLGEHEQGACELSNAASDVLRSMNAKTTLVIEGDEGEVRAWGGFEHPVASATAIQQLTTSEIGVSIGFGGRGAEGFRDATTEAARTAAIAAKMQRRPANPVTYDQVSLIGLLLENSDCALDFVHRELGKLAEKVPHIDNLRETVLAYLECRHSPRAAGERLFIAKNTVIYRLKRAEELLDRSLDERPAETWTALIIAESLFASDSRSNN